VPGRKPDEKAWCTARRAAKRSPLQSSLDHHERAASACRRACWSRKSRASNRAHWRVRTRQSVFQFAEMVMPAWQRRITILRFAGAGAEPRCRGGAGAGAGRMRARVRMRRGRGRGTGCGAGCGGCGGRGTGCGRGTRRGRGRSGDRAGSAGGGSKAERWSTCVCPPCPRRASRDAEGFAGCSSLGDHQGTGCCWAIS
jgi:hypothetical protein